MFNDKIANHCTNENVDRFKYLYVRKYSNIKTVIITKCLLDFIVF